MRVRRFGRRILHRLPDEHPHRVNDARGLDLALVQPARVVVARLAAVDERHPERRIKCPATAPFETAARPFVCGIVTGRKEPEEIEQLSWSRKPAGEERIMCKP